MSTGAVVAAAMVRRQRKIVESFRAAGATSPDRATTASALGIEEGMAFRKLRRNEVLREAGNRLYLDEPQWEYRCARRRRIAMIVPPIVVLVAAVILWIVLG
jgi:hypothetical protein